MPPPVPWGFGPWRTGQPGRGWTPVLALAGLGRDQVSEVPALAPPLGPSLVPLSLPGPWDSCRRRVTLTVGSGEFAVGQSLCRGLLRLRRCGHGQEGAALFNSGGLRAPCAQQGPGLDSFFFFKVSIFFLNNFYFYLFMAVLGLRFCARAFSSCGERGPLFIAVRGPLTIAASLVAEHRLQTRRLSNCGSRA